MLKSLKRVLSASLVAVVLFTATTTNIYAFTPSEGGESDAPFVTPGNFPGNGKNPTPQGDHGGVRITVTNMSQAGEAGIAPVELGDNYTAAINQFNDLAAILKTKVWWF